MPGFKLNDLRTSVLGLKVLLLFYKVISLPQSLELILFIRGFVSGLMSILLGDTGIDFYFCFSLNSGVSYLTWPDFVVENQFLHIEVYLIVIFSKTFSGNGYLNAIKDTIKGAATFHSYNLINYFLNTDRQL